LVRFLADENVESYVVETLIRRVPSVDIVSVHDVGLAAKDDRSILENLEDMALLSMAGEWEGQVLFVGSPPLAAPQF